MKGPRWTTGFMTETLNRPECELVYEAVRELYNRADPEDRQLMIRRCNSVMRKIDMPAIEA